MFRKLKQYLRDHTNYGQTRYLNFLYHYDMEQYFHHSCMSNENQCALITEIRILVHAIEKGLSLPHCRPGFGKEKVQCLLSLYQAYQSREYQSDPQLTLLVHSVVVAYAEFQQKHNVDISFIPDTFLENLSPITSGVLTVPTHSSTCFSEIAHSRHSSRAYSEKPIAPETIRQVVSLAQTAPSACNRQATRIYACTNLEAIDKIMQLHGGTRGFDRPAVIFAVTGDLNLYQNEYERNSVFVDGGIYTMNLLYALDSFGLASCPVIWGSEPDNDRILSSLLHIPANHKIVMLTFAGHYPSKVYSAAMSAKRNIDDVLTIVQ